MKITKTNVMKLDFEYVICVSEKHKNEMSENNYCSY